MQGRIKYQVMSEEEQALFIDRMETLLEVRGIHIDHPAMKEELKAAGCIVEGDHVRFPKDIIHKAVASVPSEFTLYSPSGKHDLKFPHPQGSFYTRTCTGAPNYLTVDGKKSYITLEDTAEWFKLINDLENIDYIALPSTCAEGIPEKAIDVYTLQKALELSEKHIWIQPYDTENTKYLLQMCAAAAGGMEQLRERPFVSFISCSVPVLKFKYMDAEIIYECAKAGVPVQPCSLPTGGANAPVTGQGTALVACADVLAQIVMLELLCPGLPIIATPLLFSMDMKTTYTLQSNTEITFARLICMQAFEQGYNIRCHSYGTGSDSMLLDGQNMIERTSLIHMMAMSDASVLGGAGQLETAKTINPQTLILDNEIFGIAKRLRAGLEVDDETLDFEEILTGDDEQGYLMSDHTLDHFMEMHRPELFFKGTAEGKHDEDRDILERVLDKYHEIMAQPTRLQLTEEKRAEIAEIVAQAAHDLSEA